MIPIQLRIPLRAAPPARGVALTRKGFRPFFLLAGAYAAVLVPLWLLVLTGHVVVSSALGPVGWHGHEMVFGYTAAVIAGFLLTAAARWTERETATGGWLVALCSLWLAGRVAMWLPLPTWVVAVIDVSFLPAVAIAVGRAVVSSRSRRNYGIVALLGLLTLANASIHLDVLGVAPGWARRGLLLGVDLIVLMMVVMSARVIPMFTRNGTGLATIRALPQLDLWAIGVCALSVGSNLIFSGSLATAVLSAAAGMIVLARTRYWGTRASLRDPMLWVLHAGHAWIGVGLLLRASVNLWPTLASSAMHALTAGAIGSLTLGMMARVARGHTGRRIDASVITHLAFIAITLAGVLRVCGPLVPSHYLSLLIAAGSCWALAFGLFVAEHTGMLVRARIDGALE